MPSITVSLVEDNATPAVKRMEDSVTFARICRVVGTACTLLTKNHLNALPANKYGYPTTGFYKKAARGTTWDYSPDGVTISVATDFAPGAMNQRYFGGTINMKDKLLTIPACAQAYGHRAGEFTNLRYVRFGIGGPQALVVRPEGTDRYDFEKNKEIAVKGLGPRAVKRAKNRGQLIVMYWLRESVDQDGDPNVMPQPQTYITVAKSAIIQMVRQGGGQNN